jgi:hypothetical protein
MSNTPTTDPAFDWSPLGEQRWRELGEAAGCSELQIRFSVARFQGASQTRAAALAGYEATGDGLRRAGYAAYRSTGVQNLLELAAVDAPEDARISDREIDAKIARLCRSQDSNISLKAIEAHQKREAARREAAASDPEPTLQEQFVAVIAALPQSGIGAALAMGTYFNKVGDIFNFPFLELCAPMVHQNFATEWARFRNGVKRADMAEYLDKCADGMVIGGDDLVSAVRAAASSGTRHKPIKESASDAA